MFATLSPDAKYIVGGDESDGAYAWSIYSSKRRELWDSYHGIWLDIKYPVKGYFEDKRGLIEPPKEYVSILPDFPPQPSTQTMKFIDPTHFLFIHHNTYFAILYDIKHLKPIKYYNLGVEPKPSTNAYYLDEAIDTSPSKHVMVAGMIGRRGGILVYHYDPKTQTLKKVWTGHFPPVDPEKEAIRKQKEALRRQTLSYKIGKFFRDLH